MKYAIAAFGLILIGAPVSGGETVPAQHRSDHYLVHSYLDEAHAEQIAVRMEALFELYNGFMRFDRRELEAPLAVRVFSQREAFETYLQQAIGVAPEDFVYLHYRDPARNELVAYLREEPEFGYGLAHQGFVQFLRAFVADPPTWMQEGLAVYFERTEYDGERQTASHVENLDWLEAARTAYTAPDRIDVSRLLGMGPEEAEEELDRFYPQAWALVSFLLNAPDRAYTRLLWDSVASLQPTASRRQNVAAVRRAAFDWADHDELESELIAYLHDRRSPADFVESGVERYAAGELREAEELFINATEQEPENYVAYYYLGLINYDEGNYGLAEFYYMRAADLGAGEAIVQFALGVNAFAAGRFDSAREHLVTAVELDSDRYGERAEQLLSRIPQ